MKLQQLRYILEVERCGLNISSAAESLFTSQPGISRQIRCLEEELGVRIFERHGRQLAWVTPAGRTIIKHAGKIMDEVRNIKRVGKEFSDPSSGVLSLATTHTQARYKLPFVIKTFVRRYPGVKLNIQQGTPVQIAEMAASGDVDCCIATESMDLFDELVMLPCYSWNRCILTPCDHPLREEQPLTLEAIAEYPIITYVFGFTGRSKLDKAFADAGVVPTVLLTAADADVIKTYVREGLGVGIVAKMAYDPHIDTDLCALDAGHLFESSVTKFGLRRDSILPGYLYDFIELFAPHLTREQVDKAMSSRNSKEVDKLFGNIPTSY
ncbi:MAG: HTH-type transcriptional regulator CysB [Sedimenticola sp.]